jgi:hypothetical protein
MLTEVQDKLIEYEIEVASQEIENLSDQDDDIGKETTTDPELIEYLTKQIPINEYVEILLAQLEAPSEDISVQNNEKPLEIGDKSIIINETEDSGFLKTKDDIQKYQQTETKLEQQKQDLNIDLDEEHEPLTKQNSKISPKLVIEEDISSSIELSQETEIKNVIDSFELIDEETTKSNELIESENSLDQIKEEKKEEELPIKIGNFYLVWKEAGLEYVIAQPNKSQPYLLFIPKKKVVKLFIPYTTTRIRRLNVKRRLDSIIRTGLLSPQGIRIGRNYEVEEI